VILVVLSEEFFVSQFLEDLDVLVAPAEILDLHEFSIVRSVKHPDEAGPARLHADFGFAVVLQKLVEPELLAGVFLEDLPVLNNIHQTLFTLKVSQAQNKNHLSLQSRLGFVKPAKTSVRRRTYPLFREYQRS
jgi:hypothetical protein